MIELPEAVSLAEQITAQMRGKRIESAIRGNVIHKFAFYSGEPEFYARNLAGKTVGKARADGNMIRIEANPGFVLTLGEGGERIHLHTAEETIPNKCHLLIRFCDDTALSVTIQGWGAALLQPADETLKDLRRSSNRVSPLDPTFTREFFEGLFEGLDPKVNKSIKHFVISEPGIWGVGNGYLQDVLFRAGIHPRTSAKELPKARRTALYNALREVISEAANLGGRDTELGLNRLPGEYRPDMDRRAKGAPCPKCGTTVLTEKYMGGSVYYCPACQPR